MPVSLLKISVSYVGWLLQDVFGHQRLADMQIGLKLMYLSFISWKISWPSTTIKFGWKNGNSLWRIYTLPLKGSDLWNAWLLLQRIYYVTAPDLYSVQIPLRDPLSFLCPSKILKYRTGKEPYGAQFYDMSPKSTPSFVDDQGYGLRFPQLRHRSDISRYPST